MGIFYSRDDCRMRQDSGQDTAKDTEQKTEAKDSAESKDNFCKGRCQEPMRRLDDTDKADTEEPVTGFDGSSSQSGIFQKDELIPMFQEQHPNITVEGTYDSSGKASDTDRIRN